MENLTLHEEEVMSVIWAINSGFQSTVESPVFRLSFFSKRTHFL